MESDEESEYHLQSAIMSQRRSSASSVCDEKSTIPTRSLDAIADDDYDSVYTSVFERSGSTYIEYNGFEKGDDDGSIDNSSDRDEALNDTSGVIAKTDATTLKPNSTRDTNMNTAENSRWHLDIGGPEQIMARIRDILSSPQKALTKQAETLTAAFQLNDEHCLAPTLSRKESRNQGKTLGRKLDKENVKEQGKSVDELIYGIRALDNQIQLMCNTRSLLMQKLSSKINPNNVW